MRKLSSLVSVDGIHGDPQSRVPHFFDEQARDEVDASQTSIGRHDEYA